MEEEPLVAKGDDIEERLIDFSVRNIHVCTALPKESVARHIRDQLIRCATSPAPNYAEARGAESQRDFVHKLKVVLKELNETRVWLKTIVRAELLSASLMEPLLDECEQLCRIIGKSITTSRGKADD